MEELLVKLQEEFWGISKEGGIPTETLRGILAEIPGRVLVRSSKGNPAGTADVILVKTRGELSGNTAK